MSCYGKVAPKLRISLRIPLFCCPWIPRQGRRVFVDGAVKPVMYSCATTYYASESCVNSDLFPDNLLAPRLRISLRIHKHRSGLNWLTSVLRTHEPSAESPLLCCPFVLLQGRASGVGSGIEPDQPARDCVKPYIQVDQSLSYGPVLRVICRKKMQSIIYQHGGALLPGR